MDRTVKFYKGSYNVQRYSFRAFQFIAKGRQFVYIHCHLIVCNASNTASRCSQGCLSSFGRLRRSVGSTTEVDLTQGPIIMENRPNALGQKSVGKLYYLSTFSVVKGECPILDWDLLCHHYTSFTISIFVDAFRIHYCNVNVATLMQALLCFINLALILWVYVTLCSRHVGRIKRNIW